MDELNIGAVITIEEDERLEKQKVDPNPWERYKAAGIIVEQGPKPRGPRARAGKQKANERPRTA